MANPGFVPKKTDLGEDTNYVTAALPGCESACLVKAGETVKPVREKILDWLGSFLKERIESGIE